MDDGYRAITQNEGAVVELGDQAKELATDVPWHDINRINNGAEYKYMNFDDYEFRRPIAQDEPKLNPIGFGDTYASDNKLVVDMLNKSEDYDVSRYFRSFDACTSNQEELDSSTISETAEWDGEVLNHKFGSTAAWEKYKMLFKGEFCLVYKSESHTECAGRFDECDFRPIQPEQTERDRFQFQQELVDEFIRPFAENKENGVLIKGYFPLAEALIDHLEDIGRLKGEGDE